MQIKAEPHCCEEASPMSGMFYIPCNAPAVSVVQHKFTNEGPYRMCEACTYHSVKNRNFNLLGPYLEQKEQTR